MSSVVCTQIEDRYPSRCYPEARELPRVDPVLHAGAKAPGPLSADEMASFDKNGCLICHDIFSADEIVAIRAALTAQPASVARIAEPDSKVVRSLFALHRGDGVPARLLRDPRLVHRAEQILGPGLYIHQSRVNRKPAFDGREFPWHSDFETWHVEDGMPAMRALSAMVYLDDNTAANGPLLVIPGTHRVYVTCIGATPENHHELSLRKQEYGVPDRETLLRLGHKFGVTALCAPAGSVAFFDCNILHGSPSNCSPLSRENIFAVYNHVDNQPVAPFGGQQPRPAHVAERGGSAIVAEPLRLTP